MATPASVALLESAGRASTGWARGPVPEPPLSACGRPWQGPHPAPRGSPGYRFLSPTAGVDRHVMAAFRFRSRTGRRLSLLPALTPRLALFVALEGRRLHWLADRNRSNRRATPARPTISSHPAAVIYIGPSPAALEVLRHRQGTCNGRNGGDEGVCPVPSSREGQPTPAGARRFCSPFHTSARASSEEPPGTNRQHVGSVLRSSHRGPRPCCPA